MLSIPGFSQEQVNGLNGVLAQMTAMIEAKLDAQNRQFQASHSSLLAAIQQLSQPANQHSNQIEPPSTSSQQLRIALQQPSTSPPVKPAVTTAKSEIQKKKQKRNEKTRLQYKRRKALRVTIQPSVKEVEHSSQVRVAHVNKPRKHVVLKRTKQVPWDGSHTSLQQSWGCAVIQWNGMSMVYDGTSGMPRIGIG